MSLSEEGDIHTFVRSVYVSENAPLELDLDFVSKLKLDPWRIALRLVLLTGLGVALVFTTTKPKVYGAGEV